MQVLSEKEIALVSGAMKWEGGRMSWNVIDRRPELYDDYSGMCYSKYLL